MNFIELVKQPWPWYVAGPLIGLMVPTLLIFGNKTFGISSSLRHICASCFPVKIPFFQYNWRKEVWNLFFVFGVFIGGIITMLYLKNDAAVVVDPRLVSDLSTYGISDYSNLVPAEIFSWASLSTPRGLIMMVLGGFLVGFGTRYAGGCTSGHAIMGLSMLQLPSLVATICFMVGGFIMANLILPVILSI